MSNQIFIKKWSQCLPNWCFSYFKGSLYDRPKECGVKLFSSLFNKESISKYELWTGTANVRQRKTQLFCNREMSHSIFDNTIDTKKLGCLEPIYLNNDIKRCALVSEASAAIPMVVPPVYIDDDLYVDGGINAASPLSLMSESIVKSNKSLHLTYISGGDFEEKETKINDIYKNIVKVGHNTLSSLVNSLCYTDRALSINLLNSYGKDIYHTSDIGSYEVIKLIEKERNNVTASVVEYYPTSNEIVDLTCFNEKDLIKHIKHTRKNFNYRIWWVSNKDVFASLRELNKNKTKG